MPNIINRTSEIEHQKQKMQMRSTNIIVLTACLLISVRSQNQTNYIRNGGFDIPTIGVQDVLHVTQGWEGVYELFGSKLLSRKHPQYQNYEHGQFINLQIGGQSNTVNGYAQQIVTLPKNSVYQITFLRLAPTKQYESYQLEVYWNGALVLKIFPNTTDWITESLLVNGTAGNNTLKFLEVGLKVYWATLIDEVSVYLYGTENLENCTQSNCTQNMTDLNQTINQTHSNQTNSTAFNQTNSTAFNQTNSTSNETASNQTVSSPQINESQSNQQEEEKDETSIIDIFGGVLALPLKQIVSLKYSLFLAEDFWLYYYNPRSYDGLANDIFRTIVYIEKIKFDMINKLVDVDRILMTIPLSEYSQYTQPKFEEIETSDAVLFKVIFTFLIFTIPSNILLFLILYWIFRALYKYKVSTIFRRYYFFGTALLQTLFEGNIAYFTYCCFNHLSSAAFSFNFADKLALMFTVLSLFIVLIVSIGFYFIIGDLLKKQSCYFIHCFYRGHKSYCYLMMYNMFIEFVKGSVHYFLAGKYDYLIGSLCALECFVIGYTIYMQNVHKIFIPKSMFVSYLGYHCCFILFNLSLYTQEVFKQQGRNTSFILDVQKVSIICIMSFNGLMMAVDLIPLEYIKRRKQPVEQQNKEEKEESKDQPQIRKQLVKMNEKQEQRQKPKQEQRSKPRRNKDSKSKSRPKFEQSQSQSQSQSQGQSKGKIKGKMKIQSQRKN